MASQQEIDTAAVDLENRASVSVFRSDAMAVLPNELLGLIFSFLPKIVDCIVASCVSRRWRQVAQSSPSLWTCFNFDRSPWRSPIASPESDALTRRLFTWSKTAPLAITYISKDHYYFMTEVERRLVADHLGHTRKLALRIDSRDTQLLQSLTCRAPLLESLVIHATSFLVDSRREWPVGFLGDHAPLLQVLRLRGLNNITWTSPIFHGLVSLNIENLSTPSGGPSYCERVLRALENMPSLESLSFNRVSTCDSLAAHAPHASRHVHLPHLRSLIIYDQWYATPPCPHILAYLDVPSTANIEFNMRAQFDAAAGLIVPLLLPSMTYFVTNWAQSPARPTHVFFDECIPGNFSCHVARETSEGYRQDMSITIKCHDQESLTELARLVWDAISWEAVKELHLVEFPRDIPWLAEPWWNVLKGPHH
ncbi:hypothetical protein FA95DRAFT_1204953 [Auriscalpium vulgare]|uniref:Uncharacterized protein n=1 Tax=Auriscalpium vulgare TaxID=40419 RepID=A0ACB8RU54_9AGAM|nr:hypothetical protein FA95DRAFT_1204953 [Auriscalpium vulgare]